MNVISTDVKKAVEELHVALDNQTLGELDEWAFDEYSYLIKDAKSFETCSRRLRKSTLPLKHKQHFKQEIGQVWTFDEYISTFL